jgi:hypothetical protein
MSDAWRMPPPFYQSPGQESVLLGLDSLSYIEGSFTLNICILLLSGVATRAVSLICLSGTNRHQMGLPPLFQWWRFKPSSSSSSSKQTASMDGLLNANNTHQVVGGGYGGMGSTTTQASGSTSLSSSTAKYSVVVSNHSTSQSRRNKSHHHQRGASSSTSSSRFNSSSSRRDGGPARSISNALLAQFGMRENDNEFDANYSDSADEGV